jgi:hypothetical protein
LILKSGTARIPPRPTLHPTLSSHIPCDAADGRLELDLLQTGGSLVAMAMFSLGSKTKTKVKVHKGAVYIQKRGAYWHAQRDLEREAAEREAAAMEAAASAEGWEGAEQDETGEGHGVEQGAMAAVGVEGEGVGQHGSAGQTGAAGCYYAEGEEEEDEEGVGDASASGTAGAAAGTVNKNS